MKSVFVGRHVRLSVLFTLFGATCLAQRYPGPLSPEQSMGKLKIANGFKVQLYAAEPHVLDPVALEFDEQGNAYVVEMPDYPYEVEPGKGKGRIRILKDTNGDGRVDKSIIFAENVTEATSILPWKGGIIVTAAPNILYLKDTNGDGKADVREILFSGFFQNNSEAQVTSLRFGVDNWIYANNRGQSGMVTFSKTPDAAPVSVRGADFRFRLDRNQFELETGPGQFGQTIDDWGHRFFTENSIHIQQSIIPWRYTHRHPYLGLSKFVVNISDHQEIMFNETPPPYWRAERTARRNKAFKEANMKNIEYAEGRFTGASGGTIYTGDAFPAAYQGNFFVTDVSGNLVHRDILSVVDKSPVMVAKRGDQEKDKEFLSSTDTWFRPITFTTGPDGYLYLLDYYRQHIETPVSIDDDLKADMDFMAGSDKGRIYRILPGNASAKNVKIDLKNTSSAKLVAVLENPNGWWRSQAHRLLIERGDKSVIPTVKALFNNSKDAKARLRALYVLEGLNALDAAVVKKALQDAEPGLRENAVMLAERFPECLPQVIQMTNDPANRVAFQAALSLGEFNGATVAPALAKVVAQYGQDSWFRTAVLSSNAGSSAELLKALLQQDSFTQKEEPWKLTFLEDLSAIVAARNKKEEVSAYLETLSQPALEKGSWQTSLLKGLKKGLSKATNPQLKEAAGSLKTDSAADIKAAILKLKALY
ncbi:PVC-type heme-binding CxxCH protein [Pedobacter heparinus]|uniref:PVC-type heme-binding CxxCH protein n=1 Tax=Pedobacter heparinus TaxID=984 RepID=UPI00292E1902|nr:PVC-type heme-binding CxxCH protein [Pedobacter heparinus]